MVLVVLQLLATLYFLLSECLKQEKYSLNLKPIDLGLLPGKPLDVEEH